MNKTKHLMLFGGAALLMGGVSCSDKWDVVDGADPAFSVASEHVRTELGREVTFSGKITDADGIDHICLTCHDLNLNKTIDIIEIYGEPKKEYDLDYRFKVRDNVVGETFTVVIEIFDVAGNKVTKEVLVTLDGDFTAPVFEAVPDNEITVLIKSQTAFNLQFTVRDNRVIDYIDVDVEGVAGFPLRIEGNGQNRVEFKQKLDLPATAATYNLTITAYDKEAQDGEIRHTEVKSTINVSELPNFDVIYLADVETAQELNSDVFGVPMAMDHVGDYRYRVRYYNQKAGTKVCFIPQKTDFGPICFGPDPEDKSVLGDDPEETGRIVLDSANTYYVFDVNTLTREYSVSTYSPADAIDPVMHLTYGAEDLNTWWETNDLDKIWWQKWYFGPATGPGDVMDMEQDPRNPHIFYVNDYRLPAGEMNIMLHNWHSNGWWNFTAWRVDNPSDPSKCVYYGNYHPTTPHYESNMDYFQWKYIDCDQTEYKYMYPAAGPFDINRWGDESYRKNFIPDNWIRANVPAEGSYRLVFDAHAERIKLIPNN